MNDSRHVKAAVAFFVGQLDDTGMWGHAKKRRGGIGTFLDFGTSQRTQAICQIESRHTGLRYKIE